MIMLHRSLKRRTFLKLIGQLFAMAASLRLRHTLAVQHPQAAAQALGYGVGAYSQGEYPGYKTYLPLVNKENR
jgi:hypothetical protein